MRNEKRRLKLLNSAINPKGSFRAKLSALTDEQQAVYQRYRDAISSRSYEEMLEGPELYLRNDVHEALYGPRAVITADMTEAEAAEEYFKMLEG